jgi:hypothetical protein
VARDLAPLDGVAFPLTEKGRRPRFSFSQLNTRPADASVYASPAASRRPVQDSRSGWSRFSFPVGLSHPLQHAGLSRRTLTYDFRRGRSAEAIFEAHPPIGSLAKVYGAITFILEHPAEVDAYLKDQDRIFEEIQTQHPMPAELVERFGRAEERKAGLRTL